MSKKRLFIIGASGLGREVESWIDLELLKERKWELAGFLDINSEALSNYPSDFKIIDNENNFKFQTNDAVIIAIADPNIKERVINSLEERSVEILSYVAPNAIIGKFSSIGKGSIVCPNSIVTTNVNIGKGVLINIGSQIGHDCTIGDFSSINANIDVAGKCKLGKKVFMGSNSMIIPGKKIGDNSIIGAGSVVIRNVKENTTVFGNPAKKVYK